MPGAAPGVFTRNRASQPCMAQAYIQTIRFPGVFYQKSSYEYLIQQIVSVKLSRLSCSFRLEHLKVQCEWVSLNVGVAGTVINETQ